MSISARARYNTDGLLYRRNDPVYKFVTDRYFDYARALMAEINDCKRVYILLGFIDEKCEPPESRSMGEDLTNAFETNDCRFIRHFFLYYLFRESLLGIYDPPDSRFIANGLPLTLLSLGFFRFSSR